MSDYTRQILALLSPASRKILLRLKSPSLIQDYLDSVPINFEVHGETYMSVSRTLETRTAHCFEGALLAAAALAVHGQKPLLMDLRASTHEDHVVALFKQNGYWGAISKTNHSTLRYRDSIYASPRELAASYFHEYIEDDGSKILTAYSAPFDLSKYPLKKWIAAGEELFDLMRALDRSRHFPLIPKKNRRLIRKASKIERSVLQIPEWPAPRKSR